MDSQASRALEYFRQRMSVEGVANFDVEKFFKANPYHDEKGRFAEGTGGKAEPKDSKGRGPNDRPGMRAIIGADKIVGWVPAPEEATPYRGRVIKQDADLTDKEHLIVSEVSTSGVVSRALGENLRTDKENENDRKMFQSMGFKGTKDAVDTLKSALSKLPTYKGVAYRGLALSLADVPKFLDTMRKGTVVDKGFSFATKSENTAKIFACALHPRLPMDEHKTSVVMTLQSKSASLTKSRRAWEEPMLFSPGTRWQITSVKNVPEKIGGKGPERDVWHITAKEK